MPDNREWEISLKNAEKQILSEVFKNMGKACLVIETDAKMRCPVDMGPLRASITSDTDISETEVVGRIGSNLEYAPYVHNGTGIHAKDGNGRQTPWVYKARFGKYRGWHYTTGQKPQPFLEDAKLTNRKKIERILGGKLC